MYTFVSVSVSVCVHVSCVWFRVCVCVGLHMCPYTDIYVSLYCYTCVLILLYMCPHTSKEGRETRQVLTVTSVVCGRDRGSPSTSTPHLPCHFSLNSIPSNPHPPNVVILLLSFVLSMEAQLSSLLKETLFLKTSTELFLLRTLRSLTPQRLYSYRL